MAFILPYKGPSVYDFKWVFGSSKELKLPMYRGLGASPKTPLILIPGLASSRVYAKYNIPGCPVQTSWEQVWASLSGIGRTACWQNLLKMGFADGKFTEPAGVTKTAWRDSNFDASGRFVITEDFGGVLGCSDLLPYISELSGSPWVWRNLINAVTARGYAPAENVFGAPYDFTRITNPDYMFEYFRRLKGLIELAFERNNGIKVVIASHSLGCPLTNLFFNFYLPQTMSSPQAADIWKSTFIKRWVPIAGPFGGAPAAVRSVMKGDGLGMDVLCTSDCTAYYNAFMKLCSGVVWMAPDQSVFQNLHLGTIQDGARTQLFYADVTSVRDMFTLGGKPDTALAFVTNTQPLSGYVKSPPGVPVHVITSSCTIASKATEGGQVYTRVKSTGDFAADFSVQRVNELEFYQQIYEGTADTTYMLSMGGKLLGFAEHSGYYRLETIAKPIISSTFGFVKAPTDPNFPTANSYYIEVFLQSRNPSVTVLPGRSTSGRLFLGVSGSKGVLGDSGYFFLVDSVSAAQLFHIQKSGSDSFIYFNPMNSNKPYYINVTTNFYNVTMRPNTDPGIFKVNFLQGGGAGAATALQNELRNGVAVADMVGDFTVPYLSLMVPLTWKAGGSKPNKDTMGRAVDVQMTHFRGGQECEHKDILANPAMHAVVMSYL